MSQYINFYIKTKENKYINIFNFSRNSAIYEYANDYIEYEKGRLLDSSLINTIINSLKEEDLEYENELSKFKNRIEIIAKFNNSFEEKIEEINIVEREIQELKQTHDHLNSAISFYQYINEIVETFKWNDENNELYAGIEWDPNYKEE